MSRVGITTEMRYDSVEKVILPFLDKLLAKKPNNEGAQQARAMCHNILAVDRQELKKHPEITEALNNCVSQRTTQGDIKQWRKDCAVSLAQYAKAKNGLKVKVEDAEAGTANVAEIGTNAAPFFEDRFGTGGNGAGAGGLEVVSSAAVAADVDANGGVCIGAASGGAKAKAKAGRGEPKGNAAAKAAAKAAVTEEQLDKNAGLTMAKAEKLRAKDLEERQSGNRASVFTRNVDAQAQKWSALEAENTMWIERLKAFEAEEAAHKP